MVLKGEKGKMNGIAMDALEPGFMGANFLNISFYCFPLREMAAYCSLPILLKREREGDIFGG